VARKKDKGGIQAVQSLSFEELLLFAQKQLSLAEEVYAAYEAGPLGLRAVPTFAGASPEISSWEQKSSEVF